MAFITVDVGEVLLLKYMLNNVTPEDVQLHLYTNNVTPTESDDLTDYTESSATGYTPFALAGTAWTFATAGGTSSAIYARQTFTFSTSETAYGYYLTNIDGSSVDTLVWAERFTGAPYTVPTGGGTIDIDPKIVLD